MEHEDYVQVCDAEHFGVELDMDEAGFDREAALLLKRSSEGRWKETARRAGSLMLRAAIQFGHSCGYMYGYDLCLHTWPGSPSQPEDAGYNQTIG